MSSTDAAAFRVAAIRALAAELDADLAKLADALAHNHAMEEAGRYEQEGWRLTHTLEQRIHTYQVRLRLLLDTHAVLVEHERGSAAPDSPPVLLSWTDDGNRSLLKGPAGTLWGLVVRGSDGLWHAEVFGGSPTGWLAYPSRGEAMRYVEGVVADLRPSRT